MSPGPGTPALTGATRTCDQESVPGSGGRRQHHHTVISEARERITIRELQQKQKMGVSIVVDMLQDLILQDCSKDCTTLVHLPELAWKKCK